MTRAWPLVVLILLMVFGIGVGGLMTWHHDMYLYGGAQPELVGCTETQYVNCNEVNTSAWSALFGVPLGTWAIVAYAVTGVLAGLALRGARDALPVLFGAGIIATLCSIALFYISEHEIGYLCAWCLRLYAVNLSIPILAALAGAWPVFAPDSRILTTTFAVAIGVGVLAIGGEHVYRGTLLGSTPKTAVALPTEGKAITHDPNGPTPTFSMEVTTEKQDTKTLTVDADDAWIGNPAATVRVVEFADLECPYCKRTSAELSRLIDAYQDRVLFVWKNFAMNPDCNPSVKNKLHAHACVAARGGVCAKKQGFFWPYHDLVFKNQHDMDVDALTYYAKQVGIDTAQFGRCLQDPDTEATVERDGREGGDLEIGGTPRIFINGKLYRSGTSAEAMARDIEIALGASPADAAKTASALHQETPKVPPVPADVPAQRHIAFGDLKFDVDTFEDALVDGKATSGKHEIPATHMSWFAANDACKSAGKRLCTEEEWVSACQGVRAVDDNHNGEFADDMVEGTSYPYGDYHEDGACWDAKDPDQFRPVYTGEMPACVGQDGVYDSTGNVEEWVGDSPEHAVLLGGSYDTPEDHARCYRREDSLARDMRMPEPDSAAANRERDGIRE